MTSLPSRWCPSARAVILFLLLSLSLLPDPAKSDLNIFIIPHSHCDPGWLNTFEGYYQQQVSRILSGVVNYLQGDKKKRFCWAEISFFSLWWEKQPADIRALTRELVKNKQLEFVAGGWVQNDEANANFDIVIDQVSEGHDYIVKNFGEGAVPRVGWQIDPFGHSSLTPSLFSRMGFQGMVINRIHHDLKARFKDNKQMEFEWTGSRSLMDNSTILTHVLHTHYSAPEHFDWEEGAPGVNSNNVAQRSQELINNLKGRARAYRTSNLLVPFGDDFKFQRPDAQFNNMDQIIEYINSHKELGATIRYATPGEYFDAVYAEAKSGKVSFPTYAGDFFPYADNADSYWTGYYTTRPTLKAHSRGTDSILRAAEVSYALARTIAGSDPEVESGGASWASVFQGLSQARRDAALVQHHDGITGTAKSFVAADYMARLDRAVTISEQVITNMVEVLMTNNSAPVFSISEEPLNLDQKKEYGIVIFNSLGWSRRELAVARVMQEDVVVTDAEGNPVPSQVAPFWNTQHVTDDTSKDGKEGYRVFFTVEVPALGCNTYFVRPGSASDTSTERSEVSLYMSVNSANPMGGGQGGLYSSPEGDIVPLDSRHVGVELDAATGMIRSLTNKDLGNTITVDQELMDYRTDRSGAYIFRSVGDAQLMYNAPRMKMHVVRGPLFQEAVVYVFSQGGNAQQAETTMIVSVQNATSSIWRGEGDEDRIEESHLVDITYSVVGRQNKETIARYNTNLRTSGVFYTDNGLEIRQRTSAGAQRPEHRYYPSLSMAYILDEQAGLQFSILSRHAMGVSSKENGDLEHMMHRNLVQDDGRGLGEPNNDGSRVQVHVRMLLHRPSASTRVARKVALMLQHPTRTLSIAQSRETYLAEYNTFYTPLAQDLPYNIHLLSLKARDGISDELILRLVHIFEAEQDATLSGPQSTQLDTLFQHTISTLRERSLSMSLSVSQFNERRRSSLLALPNRDAPEREALPHVSGVPANYKTQQKGESQNTKEEGVFLSKAALEDLERAKHQQQNEQDEVGERDKRFISRQPLSLLDVDGVRLGPMEIRSFYITMTPLEAGKAGSLKPLDIKPLQPKVTPPISQTRPPGGGLPGGHPRNNGTRGPPGRRPRPTSTATASAVTTTQEERLGDLGDLGGVFVRNQDAVTKIVDIGELEVRSFLVMSVICTALVVGIYMRLKTRRRRDPRGILPM